LKLVEKEQKAGVEGGAGALLDEILQAARKHWSMAENLEADHELLEAAEVYRQIQKKYNPLDIAKKARAHRAKLIKSDGYKAMEMLAKAKQYLAKDKKDRAHDILTKIVDKYPDTVAAEQARALLGS
jgi:TolA-binding protein